MVQKGRCPRLRGSGLGTLCAGSEGHASTVNSSRGGDNGSLSYGERGSGKIISFLRRVVPAHRFLMLCQVFPGSCSLSPTPWWKFCFPVNTGTHSLPPGEHSEHPWSLGWLLLELCPSCPYLSSSLCALPFPASLGFYKVSVPLCYPRQRHWGKWWGSPLFFRDLFGAVRAESWCGVSGEGWGGAGSEPGRSLKRGMKGYPQLPDLTHLSPSAGSPMGLLGPCCVRWHCVQKSDPQVRQSEGGGRGIPGTIWSGCFYGSGSTGHREEDGHR